MVDNIQIQSLFNAEEEQQIRNKSSSYNIIKVVFESRVVFESLCVIAHAEYDSHIPFV